MFLGRSGSAKMLPHITTGYWEVTEEKIIVLRFIENKWSNRLKTSPSMGTYLQPVT